MPRLYSYVFYQVRDKALAEELTAVVCEQALQHLHQFDSRRGEMKAWMFGIARNEIRRHMRSLKRKPAVISLEELPEVHVRGRPVENTYQVKEAFGQVLRHLDALPERYREIVALRYGAGFSNQEIAEFTGLTGNHVAVLLYRALKKLRQALETEWEK
jgi:RNA polymerase sigma-70 factor (ECF subfamily)